VIGAGGVTLPTTLTSGTQLFTTTTYGILENVIGQEVFNGNTNASLANNDVIKVTSSNTNVLSIAGAAADGTFTLTANTSQLPVVNALQAGTATLTIQDISNPSAPKVTGSITVTAGTPNKLSVLNPSGQADTAYTFASAGVSGPFTIRVTDAGGDVTPVGAPLTLTQAQVEAAIGVTGVAVRTSAGGSGVSSVTIGQNQASVQVWLDGVVANGVTTIPASNVLALNAQLPAAVSTSHTSTTVTLTFNNPIQGTVSAAAFSASTGGAATGATISGNTVTLTFGTAPSGTLTWTGSTGLSTGYSAVVQAGSIAIS
jgi:hypothetical protein